MKRMLIVMAVLFAAVSVFARPHGCGPCGPGGWHRPCGPGGWHCPPPHHHWGGGGWWGRGGCNFWPGFVGGVVGGMVCNSYPRYVSAAPVVVTQPVVQQPVVVQQPIVQTVVAQPTYRTANVWVEGRYVDTVQANGSVVRTWSPGHYEQQLVQ